MTSLIPSPSVLWEAPTSSVLAGEEPGWLPGPWRLMLLGDGSPTRHLRLLTGHSVQVRLIAMDADSTISDAVGGPRPAEVQELEPPLLRRQVWLNCGDTTLAWAESWWNRDEAERNLRNREQPIWLSLTQGRSELFREVDGLALVSEPWLEQGFGEQGPFWSRHYRFFRQGRELTVIREVFSPALERWLGEAPRRPLHATS